MSASNNIRPDANMLLFPRDASVGALGSFAKYNRFEEIKDLEGTRNERVWEVRAFVSDTVPLAGDAAETLARPNHHKLFLNENPLFIYLHKGGLNAVYYELVGDQSNRLAHIAVRVSSRLPSNALLLARAPVNALLDVLTRDHSLPLIIQRLELMSPTDGRILITEMLIPARNGVVLGPLGGIMQAVPFAPYDALYREALTSSSPFYRLLCAWKIYEGTNQLRRWIRKKCEERGVTERMPSDPDVDPQELINIGFDAAFVAGIRKAGDLFNRLADHRNAIAHFLIDRDGTESHVYVADGRQLSVYAVGASALLRYAHRVLDDLRIFYVDHIGLTQGATILKGVCPERPSGVEGPLLQPQRIPAPSEPSGMGRRCAPRKDGAPAGGALSRQVDSKAASSGPSAPGKPFEAQGERAARKRFEERSRSSAAVGMTDGERKRN